MRIYMFVPILVKIGEGKRESHQNDAWNISTKCTGFQASVPPVRTSGAILTKILLGHTFLT